MSIHTKFTDQIAIHYIYGFVSHMVQTGQPYCTPFLRTKTESVSYRIALNDSDSLFDVIGIVNIYTRHLGTVLSILIGYLDKTGDEFM